MSPTRQEIRAQRAAAAEARRQAEREAETAAPSVPTVPAPAGESVPGQPAAELEPYRPQPFTPDLIPEPVEVEAEGELTPQELDDLGHCEAAVANSSRAEWMKWKAAHAIRAGRLYRQGGRTWPEYCLDRFGESESEVNRRIQQWPLLKAITEQQDRPRAIPDSHVQHLLPMVEQHGQEVTARAYVALRGWAAERRHRVTADVVDGLVELARGAEPPALTGATFQQAIEAEPKPKAKRPRRKKEAPQPEATRADGREGGGPQTGSHPNLGGSEAAGDEQVVDAEIVEDHPPAYQATRAREVLRETLAAAEAGGLREAPAEILREIRATAVSLTHAVDEVLKDR